MISGHQHVPTFTGIDWAVGASAFIMPYGAKPMNIYSGKSHKEHLTVSLRSGTQLERYIYNNGFEPHNSRKHWIVKKDFLKKLAFEANRYLVFEFLEVRPSYCAKRWSTHIFGHPRHPVFKTEYFIYENSAVWVPQSFIFPSAIYKYGHGCVS